MLHCKTENLRSPCPASSLPINRATTLFAVDQHYIQDLMGFSEDTNLYSRSIATTAPPRPLDKSLIDLLTYTKCGPSGWHFEREVI